MFKLAVNYQVLVGKLNSAPYAGRDVAEIERSFPGEDASCSSQRTSCLMSIGVFWAIVVDNFCLVGVAVQTLTKDRPVLPVHSKADFECPLLAPS